MSTHKSEIIENYIGKIVKIVFCDREAYTGLLQRTEPNIDFTNCPYKLLNFDNRGNTLNFYKSHVKNIEML